MSSSISFEAWYTSLQEIAELYSQPLMDDPESWKDLWMLGMSPMDAFQEEYPMY